MLFMSNLNNINKWKKLYMFTTYTQPHIMYGSCKYYISKGNIGDMRSNVQYKKLQNEFNQILKFTLDLPKKGTVEPL